jgi:peroxiredoxin
VRLLAVGPDEPAALTRLRAELGLRFALASDESGTGVATLCGGVEHCEVLLDADGVVRWGGWTESWSDAPTHDALLRAARRLTAR